MKAKGRMGQGQRSTLRVKAKGQGHQVKNVISFNRLTGNVQGQRSWARVKVHIGQLG